MALLWSYDIEVFVHKNVIRTTNFTLKNVVSTSTTSDRVDAAIGSAVLRLGFSELRLKQMLAMRSFVEDHDVFISLPTSSGKSLCCWVLPWTFRDRSTVLVFSPLDTLMKDQECSLQLRQYKLAQMILTKPSKTSKKAAMKSYLSAVRACLLAKTGGICCSHLCIKSSW